MMRSGSMLMRLGQFFMALMLVMQSALPAMSLNATYDTERAIEQAYVRDEALDHNKLPEIEEEDDDSIEKEEVEAETEEENDDPIEQEEDEVVTEEENDELSEEKELGLENTDRNSEQHTISNDQQLRNAINGCTQDIGEITLIIERSFNFEGSTIAVTHCTVTLQSDGSGPYTLTQTSGRHFSILGPVGSLTLKEDVILEGDDQGGGINILNQGSFYLNGGILRNNRAVEGGAIFLDGHTTSDITTLRIDDGKIYDNTATIRGGGVHMNGGTFTMISGEIRGNHVVGSFGPGMGGGQGGGVSLFQGATFTMAGGRIIDNWIETGIFGGNGGGIFSDSSNFKMEHDATISNNTTPGMGGGVYAMNSTFIMDNGKIDNNRSDGIATTGLAGGGGIALIGNGTFRMEDGQITNNRTETFGGGVFSPASGHPVTINSGEISDNEANNGGGIFIQQINQNNLNIGSNVIFDKNTSNIRFRPPLNVENAFPNILSQSSSIDDYDHPLNGFDINYVSLVPTLRTLNVKSSDGGRVQIEDLQIDETSISFLNNPDATSPGIKLLPIANNGYVFSRWETPDGGDFQGDDGMTFIPLATGTPIGVEAIFEPEAEGGVRLYIPGNKPLQFEETSVQAQGTTAYREIDDWSIVVEDTRTDEDADPWNLIVSINDPLCSDDVDDDCLPGALVFRQTGRDDMPLEEAVPVYTDGLGTRSIYWKREKGILVYLASLRGVRETTYTTNVVWQLRFEP